MFSSVLVLLALLKLQSELSGICREMEEFSRATERNEVVCDEKVLFCMLKIYAFFTCYVQASWGVPKILGKLSLTSNVSLRFASVS